MTSPIALAAPVLGVVAYFGVGAMFGEKPMPAVAGQSYQLIEKSNCRYSSGQCGLKNVDFELKPSSDATLNTDASLDFKSDLDASIRQ